MNDTQLLEGLVTQLDDTKLAMDALRQEHGEILDRYEALLNEIGQCQASMGEYAKRGLTPPQSVNFSIRLVQKRTYSVEKFKDRLGPKAELFIETKETVPVAKINAAVSSGRISEEELEGTFESSSYYLIKPRENELKEVEI